MWRAPLLGVIALLALALRGHDVQAPDLERVVGGAGDDVLSGAAGDDQLEGGGGDDQLDGGSGQDIVNAGEGDDVIVDGLDCGPGDDTVILAEERRDCEVVRRS